MREQDSFDTVLGSRIRLFDSNMIWSWLWWILAQRGDELKWSDVSVDSEGGVASARPEAMPLRIVAALRDCIHSADGACHSRQHAQIGYRERCR